MSRFLAISGRLYHRRDAADDINDSRTNTNTVSQKLNNTPEPANYTQTYIAAIYVRAIAFLKVTLT